MFPPPIPPHHSSSREDDMVPDPLFMALRTAVARGPLGWFARRVDAWRDAREARQEAATIAVADPLVRRDTPVTPLTNRDEPPADLAA